MLSLVVSWLTGVAALPLLRVTADPPGHIWGHVYVINPVYMFGGFVGIFFWGGGCFVFERCVHVGFASLEYLGSFLYIA